MQRVRLAHRQGGGTVELADCEYHFYSSSATNMRFHVSNHDQPDVRPVFLPFIGVTNVAVVAKNAKFVMHGMGTAILVRDSLGVSFKGITIEWEKPFFAKAEITGFENGKTRVRFPARDKVVVEDPFWSPKFGLWRTVTIPDVIDKLEKRSGALENLDRAARRERGGHRGAPFFDGLLFETVRGASDYLAAEPDPALEKRLGSIASRIAAAHIGDEISALFRRL